MTIMRIYQLDEVSSWKDYTRVDPPRTVEVYGISELEVDVIVVYEVVYGMHQLDLLSLAENIAACGQEGHVTNRRRAIALGCEAPILGPTAYRWD